MGPSRLTLRSLLEFLFLSFITFQAVHSFPAEPFQRLTTDLQTRHDFAQADPIKHSKRDFYFNGPYCSNSSVISTIQDSLDEYVSPYF